MQSDPITFEQYLQSKGVVNPSRLHPNELKMWHASYVQEVPSDKQAPFIIGESRLQDVDIRIKASAILDESIELKGCASPAEFKIEAADSTDGKKKLPTFSMIAYTGGPMHPGGWYRTEPIVVDLEGMEIPSQTLPIDKGHGVEVGHSTAVDMTPSKTKLKVKGVLSGFHDDANHAPARAARELVHMAGNGFPYQASIDAHISKLERFDDGEKVTVNGQSLKGPLYVARASSLRGVAILTGAADKNTQTTIAATGVPMNPEFLAWLKANEYTDAEAAALTGKKLATLQAAWQATKVPPAPAPTPTLPTPAPVKTSIDDVIAAQRAENERREKITVLVAESLGCNPANVDTIEAIGRLALEGKWPIQQVELELLRAGRGSGQTSFVVSKPEINSDVIEAAICSYSKLPDIEKRFSERTLEAAHRSYKNGLSLLDLIGIHARRNGWRGISVKGDLRTACKAAFRENDQQIIRADGPSTIDVAGLLSNVANKFLRVGFDAVESSWRMIAYRRAVQDFKTITSYTLTGDLTYEQVAPGGEIKHGTLGETTYSNKADTFAKMIGIDRRDLINDDLGAFTSAGRWLGRGGALKFNTVFWGEWLDDAAFFPTDKSLDNYVDGATDSVLTSAGLTVMDSTFRGRVTDPDGNPIGSRPKILLVPVPLEGSALTLMTSQSLNLVTATTALTGDANIWRGRYQVVSSDYIAGSSAILLTWYLLADPNDLPAIEACFLNGVEMPTVETADMDFDRLGISLRGFHDFGVAKQEYRAGVKAKGSS